MLYKPIYGCPACMVPWYGTAIYWIFYHKSISDWLLTVGAAAGVSVVFLVFLAERAAAIEVKKDLEEKNG